MFIDWVDIISPQIVSRVTQTTPDTSQTPSRHPTDTPKYGTFWSIRGNWEKRTQLFQNESNLMLSMACTSYPPRQYPESLRQPPDTSQTLSRHPKIWHILTNPRQLGEEEPADKNESNWIFINYLHTTATMSTPLPTVSTVTQTTPRHLSGTPRHLGEQQPADRNYSNWICYQLILHHRNPPSLLPPNPPSIQSHSDTSPTPPRHFADTPK